MYTGNNMTTWKPTTTLFSRGNKNVFISTSLFLNWSQAIAIIEGTLNQLVKLFFEISIINFTIIGPLMQKKINPVLHFLHYCAITRAPCFWSLFFLKFGECFLQFIFLVVIRCLSEFIFRKYPILRNPQFNFALFSIPQYLKWTEKQWTLEHQNTWSIF